MQPLKLIRIGLTVLLGLMLIWTNLSLITAQSSMSEEPEFVPGEILVKFKPTMTTRTARRALNTIGLPILEQLPRSQLWRVQVTPGQEAQTMARLRQHSNVALVSYNSYVQASLEPNDAGRNQQWALDVMQTITAWDIFTGGDSIIIAVIDSGIDLTHEDLAPKIISGYNFIDPNLPFHDDYSHGTHVAGIAAAMTHNDLGVAGVSWGAKIMPLKILNQSGKGSIANLVKAIYYAVDEGAQIINLSLGSKWTKWPCKENMAVVEKAFQQANDAGVLLVAAAGNDGREGVNCPAAFEQAIAVGATRQSDNRSGFSNYGERLDVVAPGQSIYSTNPNNSYGYKNGTSMATPQVAGLAALIWSFSPDLSHREVRQIIETSADDLGIVGWDKYHGFGRVNAFQALKSVNSLKVSLPQTTYWVDDDTKFPIESRVVISSRTTHNPISWTAEISPPVSWLRFSSARTGWVSAGLPSHFTLSLAHALGDYGSETTTLRVDSGPMMGTVIIPIHIRYVEQLHEIYLPIMTRLSN